MAKVETEDIIDTIEVKEDDITISEEEKKAAELLSLEKIEKDMNENKLEIKKNTLFIVLVIGVIGLFIYFLPYLFK